MKTPIALCLLAVPMIPLVAAAQESARPPEIPAIYVITPFGYFHPSCVRHIADGDTVLADGREQHADGSADNIAPQCSFPSYSPAGAPRENGRSYGQSSTPATNGWVEYISATTSSSYGKLTSDWKVPAAPIGLGQTLFYFPGFEDLNDVQSIVQPVLQFGSSSAGGGDYWALSSWNCCLSGIADYSTLLDVSPGDIIVGSITSNCAAGSSSCATWNIVSENYTTGAKTALIKSKSDGQSWDWAFGAVMEVYGVTSCADYPPNTGVSFSVKLFDKNLNQIADPGWTKSPAERSISPSCSFSLTSTPTIETVGYEN
jgi:hypothetical protein